MQEYEDSINLTRHDFENHLENTSNTIDKILNSIQTFILEKYGSIHQNVHCFIDLYNCQHYLPSSTLLVGCLVVLVAMFCALLCCCLCPSSSCCACSLLRKVETLIYKSMNRRCEDLHKPLHSRRVVVPANVVLEAGREEQPRTITSITSTRNRCEHQLRSKLLSTCVASEIYFLYNYWLRGIPVMSYNVIAFSQWHSDDILT